MYRFYGALGVLVLVILITATGFCFTTRTASMVSEQLEKACQWAQEGNISSAESSMQKAQELWESRTEIMLLFVSHGKADEIETTLTTASAYLSSESVPLFLADCAKVRMLLNHFESVEYPVITNIF